MYSSSGVVDVQEGSLASSSVSVFVSAKISILLRRSREPHWLSIVRIVHLDSIGWWSELWSKSPATSQEVKLSESSGVAKIRFMLLFPLDSL